MPAMCRVPRCRLCDFRSSSSNSRSSSSGGSRRSSSSSSSSDFRGFQKLVIVGGTVPEETTSMLMKHAEATLMSMLIMLEVIRRAYQYDNAHHSSAELQLRRTSAELQLRRTVKSAPRHQRQWWQERCASASFYFDTPRLRQLPLGRRCARCSLSR